MTAKSTTRPHPGHRRPVAVPDPEPVQPVPAELAEGDGIVVAAATAANQAGELIPLVVADVTVDGHLSRALMSPADARKIGLELIAAAVAAQYDVGMRAVLSRRAGEEAAGALMRQILEVVQQAGGPAPAERIET